MRIVIVITVLALAATLAFFPTTPTLSQSKGEKSTVDGVHSSVLFRIVYFNSTAFWGRFNQVEGSMTISESGKGSMKVTVRADSVDTANQARNRHLKSPDFFDVKQFSTITFESDDVQKKGDVYEAKGKFTMHGVTKPLTVEFKRIGTGKGRKGEARTGFEGTFTIKRSDHGMKFMLGPLADEVQITISVAALIQ